MVKISVVFNPEEIRDFEVTDFSWDGLTGGIEVISNYRPTWNNTRLMFKSDSNSIFIYEHNTTESDKLMEYFNINKTSAQVNCYFCTKFIVYNDTPAKQSTSSMLETDYTSFDDLTKFIRGQKYNFYSDICDIENVSFTNEFYYQLNFPKVLKLYHVQNHVEYSKSTIPQVMKRINFKFPNLVEVASKKRSHGESAGSIPAAPSNKIQLTLMRNSDQRKHLDSLIKLVKTDVALMAKIDEELPKLAANLQRLGRRLNPETNSNEASRRLIINTFLIHALEVTGGDFLVKEKVPEKPEQPDLFLGHGLLDFRAVSNESQFLMAGNRDEEENSKMIDGAQNVKEVEDDPEQLQSIHEAKCPELLDKDCAQVFAQMHDNLVKNESKYLPGSLTTGHQWLFFSMEESKTSSDKKFDLFYFGEGNVKVLRSKTDKESRCKKDEDPSGPQPDDEGMKRVFIGIILCLIGWMKEENL